MPGDFLSIEKYLMQRNILIIGVSDAGQYLNAREYLDSGEYLHAKKYAMQGSIRMLRSPCPQCTKTSGGK